MFVWKEWKGDDWENRVEERGFGRKQGLSVLLFHKRLRNKSINSNCIYGVHNQYSEQFQLRNQFKQHTGVNHLLQKRLTKLFYLRLEKIGQY